MQSRKGFFDTNFFQFAKSIFTKTDQLGEALPPPIFGDFLLLDGTNFLLLDGTNFLLLSERGNVELLDGTDFLLLNGENFVLL